MSPRSRTIILVVTVVAAIFFLMMGTVNHDRSLKRVQQADVIRIGYSVEAPFLFLKPGGEVSGAEAEVAKVIVNRMGISRIEWRLYEFGQLIDALQAGQVDAIVAGMFITPERAARVSFSEPTFHVQQGLLVTAGNPHQLRSYEQAVASPDIKIAVISGAVEGDLLKQLGLPDSRLVWVPDALTGRLSVETGVADGLALSALTIRWMASQEQLGLTEMAEPFKQSELTKNQHLGYGAVVFRQGDKQLRSAWNTSLETFIGTPEHLKLITAFGFTPGELPGSVTTQEILSQP